MKLEQLRAALAAILAKLEKFPEDNFTDEQADEMKALNEEFKATKKQIEALEAKEEMKAASQSAGRKVTPTAPVITVEASELEKNGGFKNFGDFLGAVKSSSGGAVDKRFQATMFEKNADEGGFLVPEQMMSAIEKKMAGDDSLLPKCTQIKVSGNSMSLPIDEGNPWSGGVTAYWTAEGAQITDSKATLGQANWRLHKLAAMVKVTDELLEDAVGLESYMLSKAPEAINYKINSAIISGNGVGKLTGFLNSGFKKTVSKESGQTADTIVARNVIKMYSSMLPASRSKAAWYINAACEEQLYLMKDDLGNFIYLAPGSQMNQTPYGLLLGRPVIPLIGSMPALGDVGDIVFADLSYYYAILKTGGPKQSVSAHLFFDRDIQAYKWTMRIDGSCPFKTPVTTEFGSYSMSGIVVLEAR